ncbi:phosphopantetheine-binding protein [Streptomyces varsoviensis]|uniref:phosphopantetheine-binding protein n=1 Tax=Streptomyces varsoviensis TaxID=67373 RepID=UPI0007C43351|nr:phosphopantetheine-binding protein [Streptomyces varsoviensis]
MVSEAEPTQHISSRDDVRDTIGRVWKEVLRLDEFGYGDNFFELGGHSLTASQAISRIARALHVEIPMADFFERPTVDELAEFVTRRQDSVTRGEEALTRPAGAAPAAPTPRNGASA